MVRIAILIPRILIGSSVLVIFLLMAKQIMTPSYLQSGYHLQKPREIILKLDDRNPYDALTQGLTLAQAAPALGTEDWDPQAAQNALDALDAQNAQDAAAPVFAATELSVKDADQVSQTESAIDADQVDFANDKEREHYESLVGIFKDILGEYAKLEKPLNKPSGDLEFATHLYPLILSVLNTDGPVFEMGSGAYSTPILHHILGIGGRYLLTADSEQAWLERSMHFESPKHELQLVKFSEENSYYIHRDGKAHLRYNGTEWADFGNDKHWGVVFVDHAPGRRRRDDIIRLHDKCDIMVVHDVDTYQYNWDFSAFKKSETFFYRSPFGFAKTMIMSHKANVQDMFQISPVLSGFQKGKGGAYDQLEELVKHLPNAPIMSQTVGQSEFCERFKICRE